MKAVLSARLSKETDHYTITEKGIPSLVLMERAALACAEWIEKKVPFGSSILCLCGIGNNGGDGVCIARILKVRGYDARILLMGNPSKRSEALNQQIAIAQKYQVPFLSEATFSVLQDAALIVDALFGIGLSREIGGEWAELIKMVNECGRPVLSVDMPSGIHTDTGQILGSAICADATITFTAQKPGLLLAPGRNYAGEIQVAEIGISLADHLDRIDSYQIEETDLSILKRDPDGNKGSFGKVLTIAGCDTMFGAALLSGKAALRAGSGMVKVLTEQTNRSPLFAAFPETLASFWNAGEEINQNDLLASLDWADAVLIGPGLGQSDQAHTLMQMVLSHCKTNLVIDADGCNLLAHNPQWIELLRIRKEHGFFTLLTPHVGELSRLLQKPMTELKKNLSFAAKLCADTYHVAVLAKDSVSVLFGRDSQGQDAYYYLNQGTASLATAGSGDVLAGICLSFLGRKDLLSKKIDPLYLSALASYIHGRSAKAAVHAKESEILLAGDLCEYFYTNLIL